MPRGEQPLSGDDVLTAFAADLRELRRKAGTPPYRHLAREAHYSSTTLADAAGGQRLPTLAVTLAFVRACDGDAEAWEARWHGTADALAGEQRDPAAGSRDDQCPYVGLTAFRTEDAAWFFGRERLTDELVARVRADRFTVLFGASGSGKSSLLRAGLIPRMEGPDRAAGVPACPTVLLAPGAHPMEECAARLAALGGGTASVLLRELREDPRALHMSVLQALAGRAPDVDMLLVVDQFEEIFTLCASTGERTDFIHALLTAARQPNSRVRVVLGVRADFYGHCAGNPELAEALRDAQLLVTPMTTDELRRAISQPATAADCTVEGALLARVVADATGQPNTLPLVSHALRETWRHRRGNVLTLSGYETSGGIHHALARTAETLYENLTDKQRRLARGILLRLVALGDGTEDTKRRAGRDEFGIGGDTDAVLDAMAGARLVTLDADGVDLAHEALLHAWPRLRGWISEDRAGLLIHQQLVDAAAAWDREHRDPGVLYRGQRLTAATEWAERHRGDAPLQERTRYFLAASARHQRRTAGLRRAAIAALCVLTVVASLTAGIALQQRAKATSERDRAIAGQVLTEARQLRSTDPSLAAQLTLASYRINATPDAYTELLNTENVALSSVLTGHTGRVYAVAYNPDGRILATGGADGTVRLWRTGDEAHPALLAPPIATHAGAVYWLAFSPDGRTLATADADATVRLWNLTDPARPVPCGPPLRGHTEFVFSVSFSPDGKLLASASSDHTVRLWDVADPAHATPAGQLPRSPANIASATFSPAGRTLAVAGHDNTIGLWNVSDPAHPVRWATPLHWHADVVYAVAFNATGTIMASASGDKTVRLWNVANPRHPAALATLAASTDVVYAVAFSPDGYILASAGSDEKIRLWDIVDAAHPIPVGTPLTGHTGYVYWLAFSPDGHTLASAGGDGTARAWTIPSAVLLGHRGNVGSVAYSPDGRVLATAGDDDAIGLWNVTVQAHPSRLAWLRSGHTAPIRSLTFSPDGRVLVSSSKDGTVRLWDVTDPARPRLWGPPLTPGAGSITSVALSPDGRLMATTGVDTKTRLWDVTDPAHPALVGQPLSGHTNVVFWVGFSPDGRTLASVGADDTLLKWNVSDPARPRAEPVVHANAGGLEDAAFSPDGRTLASADTDYTVGLWNLTDPAHARRLGQPLTGHTGWVYWVGFSPDGHTLASAGFDHTVRLWNTTGPATATPVGQPLTGHTGTIRDGSFSPDGHTLATASEDGTVELTPLNAATAAARICAATTDTLTPAAWHSYVPELPYAPPCR